LEGDKVKHGGKFYQVKKTKLSIKGTFSPDQIGLKVVWLDRPHRFQADLIWCDGTFIVSNVTGLEKKYRRIRTRGSKRSIP
jgi:hypothetical protein